MAGGKRESLSGLSGMHRSFPGPKVLKEKEEQTFVVAPGAQAACSCQSDCTASAQHLPPSLAGSIWGAGAIHGKQALETPNSLCEQQAPSAVFSPMCPLGCGQALSSH